MIAETLYWLGVVVMGVADLEVSRNLGSRPNEAVAPYDPNHPLSARQIGDESYMFSFKLTDYGRQLLSRCYLDPAKLFAKLPDSALPHADQSDTITVQPNLEIVAPPDLSLDRFFQLLQFSDIKKMDVMTTMTISTDTIRSGLDLGLSASEMTEMLEKCSRKALPETVRQMIGECQTRHGEVDMGLAGGWIKVSDKMRLEELRSNAKIAPYIKDVFDERLILWDVRPISRRSRKNSSAWDICPTSRPIHFTRPRTDCFRSRCAPRNFTTCSPSFDLAS